MSKKKKSNRRREVNKHKKRLKRKAKLRVKSRDNSIHLTIPPHNIAQNKLSEAIFDYAEPLMNGVTEEDDISTAISMSIMFWNASLMGKEKAVEELDEFVNQIKEKPEGYRREFYSVFNMMYDRKQMYFKSDNRFIVDYSLEENEEGLYLEIASTVII